MTPTIKYITPRHEELVKFLSNINCVIEGCDKKLSTTSSLRFHLIYGHGLNKDDRAVVKNCPSREQNVAYFCPVETCTYGAKGHNSFSTLCRTKSHYISCHVEKAFSCQNCDLKFATEKKLNYHQKDCGIKFVCSCNFAYSGRQGLMHHIRRSKHKLPPKLAHLCSKKKCKKVKPERRPLIKKGTSVLLPRVILPSSNTVAIYRDQVPMQLIVQSTNSLILPLKENRKVLLPKQKKNDGSITTMEAAVQTDYVNAFSSSAATQTNHDNFLDDLLVDGLGSDSANVIGHDMSCQTFDWSEQFENEQQPSRSAIMPSIDFSMQTDMENALDELLLSSMSTQTTEFNIIENETYSSNSTTQTDNFDNTFDILSGLETPKTKEPPLMLPNHNNNSNVAFNYGQHMQTQTCFGVTPVETQTTSHISNECYSHEANSTAEYYDFLNNATQTDLLTYTSSTSSQTQPLESDFLVDFLNMETQTDNSCFAQF